MRKLKGGRWDGRSGKPLMEDEVREMRRGDAEMGKLLTRVGRRGGTEEEDLTVR